MRIPIPHPEQFRILLDFLEAQAYQQCSRQPLFASRYWTWRLSQEARTRYREGKDNLHEVPIPRLYWRDLPETLGGLFRFLALGRTEESWSARAEMACLCPQDGQVGWLVIPRFGRYILASHPRLEGQDYVYFGDDTLFLMGQAREMLAKRPLARVLDLCCGGGGVTLGLPDFQGQVVGIDLNPVAIELANCCAQAQGLENYSYQHGQAEEALSQEYDLVVGNPPTLSPTLTGREAFHATGTMELFLPILDKVEQSLAPDGEALMTIFSTADSRGGDQGFEQVREVLAGRRGFRYQVRRHFPIGQGRWLRHVALHLHSQDQQAEMVPLGRGIQLPGLSWRRE